MRIYLLFLDRFPENAAHLAQVKRYRSLVERLAITSTTSPSNSPPPDCRINSATRSQDSTVIRNPHRARSDARRQCVFRDACDILPHGCRIPPCRLDQDIARLSVIMVSKPPITPASPTGLAHRRRPDLRWRRLRSTPSSVLSISPSRARRTIILPPSSKSRSNTWVGCPDFPEHIVRGIDSVVDGPLVEQSKPAFAMASDDGAIFDVPQYACGEPGTKFGFLAMGFDGPKRHGLSLLQAFARAMLRFKRL